MSDILKRPGEIFGSLSFLRQTTVLRPILIGGVARLPFVWILLGIFGGVFLGPALVAAIIALWRDLATPRVF